MSSDNDKKKRKAVYNYFPRHTIKNFLPNSVVYYAFR